MEEESTHLHLPQRGEIAAWDLLRSAISRRLFPLVFHLCAKLSFTAAGSSFIFTVTIWQHYGSFESKISSKMQELAVSFCGWIISDFQLLPCQKGSHCMFALAEFLLRMLFLMEPQRGFVSHAGIKPATFCLPSECTNHYTVTGTQTNRQTH